jgi:diketogulonate reductase-like aldo/keto reductase
MVAGSSLAASGGVEAIVGMVVKVATAALLAKMLRRDISNSLGAFDTVRSFRLGIVATQGHATGTHMFAAQRASRRLASSRRACTPPAALLRSGMRTTSFPDDTRIPALGQGTWMMAERPERRAEEVAALREGVALGMTLIDTAEMYGEGAAETLVGKAIAGMRERVFLVSKAYPHNASRARLPRACEASLRRLGTDRIDLYLLHWRGSVPLAETVEAMERLVAAGKILRWGVSNLDTDDMEEMIEAGGTRCATDQILYNLSRRGPELDLLPWLAERSIPVMAYSPVEQGRLLRRPALQAIADRLGVTPAQVALAWLLQRPGVIAIPKAGSVAHVRENRAAADLVLGAEELAELDRAFPRPARRVALEMI